MFISSSEIKFDKKIITSTEKSVADTKEVILTNMSNDRITWQIDTSALLSKKGVFFIAPNKGVLEYNQDT